MTHSELLDMRRIVNEAILKEHCSSVSDADLQRLKATLNIAIEESSAKRFLKHIEDAMPTDDNDESWDKFYAKPFVITFNCQSLTIPMDATVYQTITDMLKTYIEEQYEGHAFVQQRKMYGYMQRIKLDLQRIQEANADQYDPDLDKEHLAIHDIKDTMSNIIDELLEIFKS